LEGEGEILTDEGPRPIAQGDYVLIKPQERHQYRNPTNNRLVFMCMVPKDYE
jgi:quercetin dioxygenase-like cupin family protein